jgi:hypothetical protein
MRSLRHFGSGIRWLAGYGEQAPASWAYSPLEIPVSATPSCPGAPLGVAIRRPYLVRIPAPNRVYERETARNENQVRPAEQFQLVRICSPDHLAYNRSRAGRRVRMSEPRICSWCDFPHEDAADLEVASTDQTLRTYSPKRAIDMRSSPCESNRFLYCLKDQLSHLRELECNRYPWQRPPTSTHQVARPAGASTPC